MTTATLQVLRHPSRHDFGHFFFFFGSGTYVSACGVKKHENYTIKNHKWLGVTLIASWWVSTDKRLLILSIIFPVNSFTGRKNNWPPLPEKFPVGPCFYHDISVDIPVEFQKTVKIMYYLWMCECTLSVQTIGPLICSSLSFLAKQPLYLASKADPLSERGWAGVLFSSRHESVFISS